MVELDIKFKGNRKYLHSTDVYTALQDYASQTLGISAWVKQLAFRKLATHQCRVVTHRPDVNDATCATASLISAGGEEHRVWLVETDREVSGSYEFDESAISARVRLDNEGRRASVEHRPPFLVIEELVTAVKVLNYELYPGIPGSWLFGKLQLQEKLPDHPLYLSVQLTKAIDGRFSICEVAVDNRRIGDIQFIVGDTA